MNIKAIAVGTIEENTYILEDDEQAILIDPGADYAKIKNALGNKPCKHILLTHAHYDHIGAVKEFQQNGALVYLHKDDLKLLNGTGNLAAMFGEPFAAFTPDVILTGEETLAICSTPICVLSTPGHTDGSVCYLVDDAIFSGDTLFYLSVGRTDFPSGNAQKLKDSLQNKLFRLVENYKVFPGHGQATSLTFEKKYNPYV